jgi:hypothetical protein
VATTCADPDFRTRVSGASRPRAVSLWERRGVRRWGAVGRIAEGHRSTAITDARPDGRARPSDGKRRRNRLADSLEPEVAESSCGLGGARIQSVAEARVTRFDPCVLSAPVRTALPGPHMWRKFGKAVLYLLATIGLLTVLLVISWVVKDIRSQREYARQQAEQRVADAYAARLRADGDRLAQAGQWEDALTRYDQALDYDRGDVDQEKLRVIKEHVGEVVWDKEFEAHKNGP